LRTDLFLSAIPLFDQLPNSSRFSWRTLTSITSESAKTCEIPTYPHSKSYTARQHPSPLFRPASAARDDRSHRSAVPPVRARRFLHSRNKSDRCAVWDPAVHLQTPPAFGASPRARNAPVRPPDRPVLLPLCVPDRRPERRRRSGHTMSPVRPRNAPFAQPVEIGKPGAGKIDRAALCGCLCRLPGLSALWDASAHLFKLTVALQSRLRPQCLPKCGGTPCLG